MIHLMKLEMKKVRIKRYILFSLLGIVYGILFTVVGLSDSSSAGYDYRLAFQMVQLVFCFYYILLFAVLTVAYVIHEYTNKTILVLFAYPVDKRRLILAKLCLVAALIAVSMTIGFLCCGAFIIWVDQYFDLVKGEFRISVLGQWASAAVKEILMFCGLGMWTFIFGMIRKSLTLTFVSAVVLCYVRQFLLAGTNQPEETWLMVVVTLAVTAAGVWYTLKHRIVQIE